MLKLISLLALFILAGCVREHDPIKYQRSPSVDMAIVFVSSNLYRSGNGSVDYKLLDYPQYTYRADITDPKCVDPNIIKVGNTIVIPVSIIKNSTYPTGYIEPPTNACVISSTAKPFKKDIQ